MPKATEAKPTTATEATAEELAAREAQAAIDNKPSVNFLKEYNEYVESTTEAVTEDTTSTTTHAEPEVLIEKKPDAEPEKPKAKEEKKEDQEEKKPKRRAKGYEDVPEIVSELKSATKAMTDVAKEISNPKPQPKPVDEFQYSNDEKDQLETFAEMEAHDPVRCRGLEQRARTCIKTIEGHIEKLLKENPDMTADQIEDARFSYQEKMGVTWSQTDFNKAQKRLETKPLLDKIAELEKQVGKISKEGHQEKVAPKAKNYAARVVREEVVDELGEEFKGLLDEDGKIVKSVEEKMVSDDPLIADLVLDTVERARSFSEAVSIVFNGGDTDLKDQVVRWALNAEAVYSKLPREDRINESGKLFAPRADWNRMDDETRAKHWIVGPDEIIPLATDGLVKQTKAQITKIRDRDQKKYPAPKVEPEPKKLDKPISPAAVGSAPSVEPDGAVAKNFLNELRYGTK